MTMSVIRWVVQGLIPHCVIYPSDWRSTQPCLVHDKCFHHWRIKKWGSILCMMAFIGSGLDYFNFSLSPFAVAAHKVLPVDRYRTTCLNQYVTNGTGRSCEIASVSLSRYVHCARPTPTHSITSPCRSYVLLVHVLSLTRIRYQAFSRGKCH